MRTVIPTEAARLFSSAPNLGASGGEVEGFLSCSPQVCKFLRSAQRNILSVK
jgi:hypothetical protein